MRITHKNRSGQPYRFIGKLSDEDDAVLTRLWRGEPHPEARERIVRKAGAILKGVQDKDAWLACDCLGEDHHNPPILFVRCRDNSTLHLVRMPDRPEHATDCVFHWKEGELTGNTGHVPNKHLHAQQHRPGFIIYRNTEEHTSISGANQPHVQSSEREDAMAKRLYWILEASVLNRINGPQPKLSTQLAMLRDEAKEIRLFSENDLSLADILWTNTDWLYKGWARHKLLELSNGSWPKRTPLQGYLVLYAEKIDGNVINAHQTEIHVKRLVSKSRRDAAHSSAPYVVIVSLKLREDGTRLDPIRAFAHPVMKHSLFPVDSDMERDAANLLEWVATKAQTEHGQRLEIEKPLSAVQFGTGEACRPDFLIRHGERVLFVETMCNTVPTYRQLKERTHGMMSQVGDLFLDERHIGKEQANKVLASYVFRWCEAATRK